MRRRRRRPRHEHDPPARRRRRRRSASREVCGARRDHAARRGRRRRRRILLPAAGRPRAQRARRLPARIAESLGAERTLLVATSAVRDAENGEAFLGEIEWSYGFATRLLSGEEEAATDALAASGATAARARGRSWSTSAAARPSCRVGESGVDSVSRDAGSVRLTERFLHVRPAARRGARTPARRTSGLVLPPTRRDRGAIGVAGTITTAAQIERGGAPRRSHGDRLTCGVDRRDARAARRAPARGARARAWPRAGARARDRRRAHRDPRDPRLLRARPS